MRLKIVILLSLFILLTAGCTHSGKATEDELSDVKMIIWDPEHFLQIAPLSDLTTDLSSTLSSLVIIHEKLSDNTVGIVEREFSNTGSEQICVFMVISARSRFHMSTEWNLWMPQLWRELDCKGKILLVDAPWADEFLNPLKTAKADSIWAINGIIGNLRKKLPGSMLAGSCRYDEANLLSMGMDSKKRIPVFSWYFFENLKNKLDDENSILDLAEVIESAANLTAEAAKQEFISELEETLFFNRSEIHREEFASFPHPVVWNGLSDQVILRKGE